MRELIIAKEGFIYIAWCLLVIIFSLILYKLISAIGLALKALVIFCFCDPHRSILRIRPILFPPQMAQSGHACVPITKSTRRE